VLPLPGMATAEPSGAAAPATGPSAPASSGPPVSPATVGRSPSRPPWWTVAAGVAVAVVVFLSVVLWGASAPASGSGPGVPFSRAEAAAMSAVGGRAGGSWVAIGAVGLDERSTVSVPTSDLVQLLGTACTVGPWNGTMPPSVVTVPAFSGSFSSGFAPLWLLFENDATTGALVLVQVLNGSASPLAEISGSGCSVSSAAAHALPATTVDSPVVARAAWTDDGSAWVTGDPALSSLTLAAFGGGKYSGIAYSSLWAVVYSPCDPLLGGSTQQPIFVATFNLTTGALGLAVPYHIGCPS